ncbi:uncharacterized protein LOC109533606 [Dendroctonus ponderosae]|uniref:Attacin C-terminal domain-containing protein n=1 Tax=Dendroctonus ponderosae TaxID=77166 RepID=U4U5V6_DENPD|nr:uncharacterized protein LOC109533606 [Dendroctonus ponderosae]ERL88442.1 hypothetical protein D910_05828 [Dendroctonus ponderosae]KAH1017365.1 hypothetical protein HUJ05_008015 [Dendroctonus ponderosae]
MDFSRATFFASVLLAALVLVSNIEARQANFSTYRSAVNSTASPNTTFSLLFNATAINSRTSSAQLGNASETTLSALNITSGKDTTINNNTGPVTFPPFVAE